MSDEKSSTEQEKVTKEWDAIAVEWDGLASGYRDSFFDLLQEYLNSELVVVDFGCGSGLLTEKIHPLVEKVICIDASPLMVEQVKSKILSRKWENVTAHCVVLSDHSDSTKQLLDEWKGQVDVVVASSVLSFIPDLQDTVKVLGTLMKPGARLCHSDWPKSESAPTGFTEESALTMYASAGMVASSAKVINVPIGGGESTLVFWGVATREAAA
jgi:2-polyprenyl-3-methyl-5-hydroxy-6-metoxy-1,4-benzoquinol methylase